MEIDVGTLKIWHFFDKNHIFKSLNRDWQHSEAKIEEDWVTKWKYKKNDNEKRIRWKQRKIV